MKTEHVQKQVQEVLDTVDDAMNAAGTLIRKEDNATNATSAASGEGFGSLDIVKDVDVNTNST